MKPFNINRHAGHYRLATVYSRFDTSITETDICRYSRSVVVGAMWYLMFMALVGLFAAMVGDFAARAVAMIVTEQWLAPDLLSFILIALAGIGTVVAAMILTVASLAFVIANVINWRKRKLRDAAEPSYYTTAFRAWRNKYCIPVKIGYIK